MSEEPAAYVIGFVDFLGCKIDLSERPLIPRTETEFWVEQAVTMIYHSVSKEVRCLDIFAGSGCIGIAVLRKLPTAIVDFIDSDPKAVRQIQINCKLNNVDPSRYRIIRSDIFENVHASYDYIFANPPYVAEERRENVQDSVLDYEPHTALFSGPDGLGHIKRFLDKAKEHLNKGGKVYLEFDEHQKDKIEEILREKSFKEISFHRDQFGRWRYLHASP